MVLRSCHNLCNSSKHSWLLSSVSSPHWILLPTRSDRHFLFGKEKGHSPTLQASTEVEILEAEPAVLNALLFVFVPLTGESWGKHQTKDYYHKDGYLWLFLFFNMVSLRLPLKLAFSFMQKTYFYWWTWDSSPASASWNPFRLTGRHLGLCPSTKQVPREAAGSLQIRVAFAFWRTMQFSVILASAILWDVCGPLTQRQVQRSLTS